MGRNVQKEIRLNLGSGTTLLEGFVNIDIEDIGGENFIRADVRKLPLPDNYADYILARQILEHIPFYDILETLKEWMRVLKPGGEMVITCPDFNQLAEEWLNTEFNIKDYYELSKGIYGSQRTGKDFHLSPITPQLMRYCFNELGQDSEINVYPRFGEVVNYRGYNEEGKVYRYGEVHVLLKKETI